MADNYATCLLGAMDHLWFHQIILFPKPTSLIPNTLKPHLPFSESLTYQSSNNSISEEDISPVASAILSPQKDDCEKQEKIKLKTRPTRLNYVSTKTRSHSSSTSPSATKSSRNLRYSGSVLRLQKTMSCKTLCELEGEEVKGFMDLGFIFNKENLSPKMMSVIPGLQRIHRSDEVAKDDDIEEEEEEEEEEEKRGVMRPYLSEAWLIKRPDSPLLHMRIPRVCASAEMKKHLRYWARAVAHVIQQES